MAQKATIQIKLGHRLVMTPSLQYAIKLLPMSRLELQDTMKLELAQNPVLEEATDVEEEVEIVEEMEASEGTQSLEIDTGEPVSGTDETAEETATAEPELEVAPREQAAEEFTDDAIENFFSDYQEEAWKPGAVDNSSDLPSFENTLTTPPNLSHHLLWQLDCTPCTARIKEIGVAIIGNLEEDGYLRTELAEIAAMGPYEICEVEEALQLVQQFDPSGIAARSMRECMLVQLRHLGLGGTLTETLVQEHLDLLQSRDYAMLCQRVGCPMEELEHHLDIIRHLDPQPGLKYQASSSSYVVPDVFVQKVGDDFTISLNEEGVPHLRISPIYARLLASKVLQQDDEGKKFVRERFKAALWLIKSLDQRQRTIYRVSESIVRHQRDFFDRGKESLRPMVLRDVAEDVGVHESTVGRVVANKYMESPQGIHPMKFFFNRGLNSDHGESVSTIIVKRRILDLITRESHSAPLSDSAIAVALRVDRLQIARRTVAKYREELKIPSSQLRRNGTEAAPISVSPKETAEIPQSEDQL